MKEILEKIFISMVIFFMIIGLISINVLLIKSLFPKEEIEEYIEITYALPALNGVQRKPVNQKPPIIFLEKINGVEKIIIEIPEFVDFVEYIPSVYYETYLREDLRYYWYTTPFELTDDEYEMLCNVVSLESGGEPEETQMVIATTIRNSIESGLFGDKVFDIIYRPGFYEVMGWIWEANPSDTTRNVVDKVFRQGIMACDKSVLYFQLNTYHQWSTCYPAFMLNTVGRVNVICFSYSTLVK